jgi:uncharacterized glyoxalase superfamily protein PhnB
MALQLKTIGIIANDMGTTLAFYRTLGIEIPLGGEQKSNVEVEMPNGLMLGFLTAAAAKEADPNFQAPLGQTMNLQFMVDSPAEVDAVYERLTAASYSSYAAPWDAFWGQRFARVTDPDGRIVNIYAHL